MKPRPGISCCNARAHARDHAVWTRREFIARLGLASVGSSLLLQDTPVQALESASFLNKLAAVPGNRVLVLLQLSGGNDGINTVIPYNDDLYYAQRGNLAIARDEVEKIDRSLGLHPALVPLRRLWDQGTMAVVQNVGYPEPDLSHFRSKDIWDSASDADEFLASGWGGRSLEELFPGFTEAPSAFPLAVQIGSTSPLLFQGDRASLSMALNNPDAFERLAQEGTFFSTDGLPQTAFGREMAFMRSIANDSFIYAEAIQQAAEQGVNTVDFPDNGFSRNLQIVSRLIKGGLGARLYLVRLSGFDTHSNQRNQHANLLETLAQGVAALYADLAADHRTDQVLFMTFSEFGRRLQPNASNGTDHGTAAPLFIFGDGTQGGFTGTTPDLADLDERGNIRYQYDFRQVYATMLNDWFGMGTAQVRTVLGGAFSTLPLIDPSYQADDSPTTVVDHPAQPAGYALDQNYPNPFNPTTRIRYTLPTAGHTRLSIYNSIGQTVQQAVDQYQEAGIYTRTFNASALPSGTYFYRLESGSFQQARKMLLQK